MAVLAGTTITNTQCHTLLRTLALSIRVYVVSAGSNTHTKSNTLKIRHNTAKDEMLAIEQLRNCARLPHEDDNLVIATLQTKAEHFACC